MGVKTLGVSGDAAYVSGIKATSAKGWPGLLRRLGQYGQDVDVDAFVPSPQPAAPTQDLISRLSRAGVWLTQPKLTHGALVIVEGRREEVLLMQRRVRDHGRWGLPGGFLKRGESPAKAASRELAEETGLLVPVDDLHRVAEYKQPWCGHYDHVYWCTAPDKAAIAYGRRIKWLRFADIDSPTDATALALEAWWQLRNGKSDVAPPG
jgi:ADP-ribose pyrophosphatase YjhB (NUDIX family)